MRMYRSIILNISVDGELSLYLMTETNMDLKMFVKKKIVSPRRKQLYVSRFNPHPDGISYFVSIE